MKSNKISYSRGFPCGAPMVQLRGGALKRPEVKEWVRNRGFRWYGESHAYRHYMYGEEFREVLMELRRKFDCEIVPKSDMDKNYTIDLLEMEA